MICWYILKMGKSMFDICGWCWKDCVEGSCMRSLASVSSAWIALVSYATLSWPRESLSTAKKSSLFLMESNRILGLASYYGWFLKGFSSIVVLLAKLTQKGVTFKWNEDYERGFQELKHHLSQSLLPMYVILIHVTVKLD